MVLTPEEKIIKEFLIKCAITKKIVTYQNLSTVANLGLDMSLSKDRNTIGVYYVIFQGKSIKTEDLYCQHWSLQQIKSPKGTVSTSCVKN